MLLTMQNRTSSTEIKRVMIRMAENAELGAKHGPPGTRSRSTTHVNGYRIACTAVVNKAGQRSTRYYLEGAAMRFEDIVAKVAQP